MATRIFINYRRDDTTSTAGRLHDRLAESFGRENLFMDVDHIPAGVDFIDHLKTQVTACDDFLAIIGPNWLDARNENGERRLHAPDDFVSIEIAAALNRNIRVIPVLVDGARMPKEDELPELLRPLVRRQAVELRNAHFGRDVEAVIEKIRRGRAGYGWRVPAMGGAMAATLVVSGLLYWTGVSISLPWATRSEIRAEQEGNARAAAEAERTRADTERRAGLAEQERKARAEADVRLAGVLAEVERSAKGFLREQQERNATAAAAAEERTRAERIERERLAALNTEAMARAERAERESRTARKTEERARAERAERERREAMAPTERAERERRTARKAEEGTRAERPAGDSRTARKAQSTARVESPERKRLLAPTVIAESHEGDGLLTRLGHRLDAIGRAREAWQRGTSVPPPPRCCWR